MISTQFENWQKPVLISIIALGAMLLTPGDSKAAGSCTMTAEQICAAVGSSPMDDCDNDGIPAIVECTTGLTLNGGRIVPKYTKGVTTEMLDPSKPDLFFLATDFNGNELTTTSLMYKALGNVSTAASNALNIYSNQLGVKTHYIKTTELIPGVQRAVYQDAANSIIVRAAWIRESSSLTDEGTYLGSTLESKPSDLNVFSTIYTTKIKNNVDKNCPRKGTCAVANTSPAVNNSVACTTTTNCFNDPIVNHYIKQVISHEMGHGSRLGGGTDVTTNYHYGKSGTVMDPSASFSGGIYTIPSTFEPVKDPPAVALK